MPLVDEKPDVLEVVMMALVDVGDEQKNTVPSVEHEFAVQ
jgi:hypothetical protein